MKYDADLYIIAAGKGSRMGGNVPKALVPITNEPNLTTTLKQVGGKFDSVFIVTNKAIQAEWENYLAELDPILAKNVYNLPIDSGLGDGHAVLQGLTHYLMDEACLGQNDDIVICWGDVFFPHGEIIDELIDPRNPYDSGSGVIPVVRENTPYVTILTDIEMQIQSADFSKYGEQHPTGFHDQSVFRFNRRSLTLALTALHNAYWKNGRYITQGGELSLLYAFHYFKNTGVPMVAYETNYPTLSFNTVAEVEEIQKEINERWKMQARLS